MSDRCSLPSSSSRAPCHSSLPDAAWSTSAPCLLPELWLPAFSELGNQITKLAEIMSDKPPYKPRGGKSTSFRAGTSGKDVSVGCSGDFILHEDSTSSICWQSGF